MRALTSIKLDGVSFAFGANTVLNQIDLHIDAGSIVALLGPSGCGKSTLLRLLAGLTVPASGSIHFGDRLVAKAGWGMPPEQRDLGMVFQDYALWPHMTAAQNVAFPLRMRGVGRQQRQQRVEEALAMSVSAASPSVNRRAFPADSSSALRWPAPSSQNRACCCSMSRSPISTASCASRCVSK